MGEHILFPAFCSVTKKTFIVSAEYQGGVVTWQRGFFKDKLPASSVAAGSAPEMRNVIAHRVSNFTCPGCGFKAKNDGEFWFCSSCTSLHCFGALNGKHHGACGSCVHDTGSFVQLPIKPLAASGDLRRGDY